VLSDPALRRDVTLDLAGRRWRLVVEPTSQVPAMLGPSWVIVARGIGLLVTVLLTALVAVLSTGRDRALAQVERATLALRADIARREQVESDLRQREAELEAFAGVAVHDLKSPLAAVAGFTEILQETLADHGDAMTHTGLHRIAAATRRMRGLIDDLLTYATAGNGRLERETVDLNGVVADIVADLDTGGDAPPHVEIGHLPVVDADPLLLRQVMSNLVGNAVKYVRPGDSPYVHISAREDGDQWRIQVADRGIGINPADRDTIFHTFQRARGSEGYPGTGLGLAICQRIIDRHGGRIGVDADPRGGSRFWFTIGAATVGTRDRREGPIRGRQRDPEFR
jgi:signal transduction histidine kinase